MKHDVNIIVAVDQNGGFGKDGKIPWYYPEDFKHFKEKTAGCTRIMGRKTYDDMLEIAKEKGRDISKGILPNRKCYVMSNTTNEFEGAEHTSSITNVLRDHEGERIFVLGGEKVFQEALSWAETVHVTVIEKDAECDRFFPINILTKHYKIVDGKEEKASDGTILRFVEYKRK